MADLGLFLGVALAGAIGAPSRYLLDGFIQARTGGDLPYGTLAINVSGSLLLGFITGLVLYHALPNTPKVLLGTGFCGAFTTFSTFAFESVRLSEEGEQLRAVLNVGVSVAASLLAAALGLVLASAL
jgi:fluoride exporter